MIFSGNLNINSVQRSELFPSLIYLHFIPCYCKSWVWSVTLWIPELLMSPPPPTSFPNSSLQAWLVCVRTWRSSLQGSSLRLCVCCSLSVCHSLRIGGDQHMLLIRKSLVCQTDCTPLPHLSLFSFSVAFSLIVGRIWLPGSTQWQSRSSHKLL